MESSLANLSIPPIALTESTAWYGHLRYTSFPLWKVVLASWSIALIEYCSQVPANRFGYAHFSAVQLKTIQEILTLAVFAGFSIVYLKEALRWNHLVAFVLIRWRRLLHVQAVIIPGKCLPSRPHQPCDFLADEPVDTPSEVVRPRRCRFPG